MPTESVLKFSQFFVTLMTVYVLIYIWYKYNTFYRKSDELQASDEVDYGLILLALGVFIWGLISLFKGIFGSNNLGLPIYEVASTINNSLILLSFPFFVHGFKVLKKRRARTNWFIGVGVVCILLILFLLGLTAFVPYEENTKIYKGFSQFLSIVTSFFLGIIFHNTFSNRKLSGMVLFSWGIIFLIFLPQLIIFLESAKIVDLSSTYINEQLSLLSTVGLSILLVSLSLTWIAEISKDSHLNIFSTSNDQFQKDILHENISFNGFTNKTEEFIKKDQLEEAIESISTFLRNKNLSHLSLDSIALMNRLSRLNTCKIRGEIISEKYEMKRNELRTHILKILDNIKNTIKKSRNNT